ncbi:molybdopterin-dependent oxidoreductase [Nocardia stercoris]|uniref:Oxidoreductase n=1 Tax=Nocardia stercoris TaxID=2483361 RepID=A0A3M2LD80_9NOCA|nr:molybdopterin-dependent oxidoreductase [Nocardia stercoris]RMI35056.1 oxidoreductase [Nocardia stercoris]
MAASGLRATAGVAAAALTLGVAELVAAPVGAGSAPLAVLGAGVIDHTPDRVREAVIKTVGTDDKLVLYLGMGVVAFAVAALAGWVERRNRPAGSVLLAVFGLFVAAVAVGRPAANWSWALPSLLGVAAGIAALRVLVERIGPAGGPPGPTSVPGDRPVTDSEVSAESGSGAAAAVDRESASEISKDAAGGVDSTAAAETSSGGSTAVRRGSEIDRRGALRGIAAVGAAAAVAGVVGRLWSNALHSVAGERAELTLPTPVAPPVSVDPGADLRLPGLTPFLTPNRDFYRIDTALLVPQVSTDSWSLRIHGMVEREIRLTWADLQARQPIERLVTLCCVSNPVGGDLIGNARWLGFRLDELLAAAGPHPDADMVLSHSIDGFTAGSPLSVLTDGRDALLAIGMNGEPLPIAHGYPARLVVPGLYGYVSATKWVTELEVTRFDRAQAYWTQRGWSAQGPVKTGTRIDVPRDGASPAAGPVTVAGVAWAQHRGITAVEVQIDDGPWQPARLAVEPTADTWRQWSFDWPATPGRHTVRARATDGTGAVQTGQVHDVVPDGATGYPSITVRVG